MSSYTPENVLALDSSAPEWCGAGVRAVLDSILDAVPHSLPGTHIGISAANEAGACTTLAGSDPLVFMLDELQCELDEGPGLSAMREDHTVIVDDTESEHRWPRFVPYAVDWGVRSYLGLPLTVADTTVGALNLYATAARVPVDASRLAQARLFAGQAALALGQARREHHLRLALESSRTIGTAIGLAMERFDLDADDAFAYLARISQRSGLKLRDIAAHMVKQTNDLQHISRAGQSVDRHPTPAQDERLSPGLTLVPDLDAVDD
jgi:GAF domain-containing protein